MWFAAFFWFSVWSQPVQWNAPTEKRMWMKICIQSITGSLQTTLRAQTWMPQSLSVLVALKRSSVIAAVMGNRTPQMSNWDSTNSTGIIHFQASFKKKKKQVSENWYLCHQPGQRTLTEVSKPVTIQTSISSTGAMKKWRLACLRYLAAVRSSTQKTWMSRSKITPAVDQTASISWRYGCCHFCVFCCDWASLQCSIRLNLFRFTGLQR